MNTYHLIKEHREEYDAFVRTSLQTGVSFPKSLHYAYEQLSLNYPASYIDLSQPNNILGFHYIEAADRLGSAIQPLTIPRIAAGYHDDLQEGASIASATGIRKQFAETGSLQGVKNVLPEASCQYLYDWQKKYGQFASWEAFWSLLQFTILRHSPNELTRYAEVTEGIEHALVKAAKTSDSFKTFMEKIKSKRYTWTRLQRMLTHIYTGFTKEQLSSFDTPSTIRLLGMTKQGQHYLGLRKKEFTLPLISRVAATNDKMLAIDLHAAEIYNFGVEMGGASSKLPKDYQTPPIRF